MYVYFLFLSLLVNQNEAARILAVFPMPSISHQVVFRSLIHELIKRGHEIVVITTDPAFSKDKTPANLTEINVHDISYKLWNEFFISTSKRDFQTQMEAMAKAMARIFDAQLENEDVQKLINDKNKTFDLLLVEACMRPALLFSAFYKVPVIQVSSFGAIRENYEVVGAPIHLFIYPTTMHQRIYNLTFYEKVTEIYNTYLIEKHFGEDQTHEMDLLLKYLGKNAPSMRELKNNVHMLFLNINRIFEGIRPVPPTVVYIGGIHKTPEKELSADLKAYLDSSKNGIIYVSFGTNVDPSLLPSEQIQLLVKIFSQLPFDVLFKWNTDYLPGRTENVKIFKWLPQSNLLKHPNIKLFITQGGLQSTDEAIMAGVPLIGMPMFGDQFFNVEKYVHHKIGIGLNLRTLTEEELRSSIDTVINDDSYRRNIVHLRELMFDEPMKPMERAIWWIDYVVRHGGATHLRAAGANISWTQYLELELILTLSIVTLIGVIAFLVSIWLVCSFIVKKCDFRKKIKTA